jgi:hypothetical protein
MIVFSLSLSHVAGQVFAGRDGMSFARAGTGAMICIKEA